MPIWALSVKGAWTEFNHKKLIDFVERKESEYN